MQVQLCEGGGQQQGSIAMAVVCGKEALQAHCYMAAMALSIKRKGVISLQALQGGTGHLGP